ncbi:MAG TPA: hypothetical protein VFQ25_11435 [Ktedonobacterales bacterium]|nr:hypothetical protein [Ktedonobacterales bacterium]
MVDSVRPAADVGVAERAEAKPIAAPLASGFSPVPRVMRAIRLARSPSSLPWLLLAILLIIGFVTVLTQAGRYGVTIDEPLQQVYGERVLAWYRSHGQDRSFLTKFGPELRMPEHGGIFDAVIAALQSRLPGIDPWLLRHTLTGLTGWLGVVAIALCGYELGGPWVAFAAALGLWLYPRYYGAIYNNPKDIPAAVTTTLALWATLLLLKYWRQRGRALEVGVLLGLFLGVATAIRVTTLMWCGILLILLAGWWVTHGRAAWRERRMVREVAWQGSVGGVIAGTWLLSTILLWPFVFLNPIANLLESAQVMAHFPWDGPVLYGGVVYPATQLPTSYSLTWIGIGSPPVSLLLAALGVVLALAELARARRVNPPLAVIALAFAVPLAAILILHSDLYDSLRQILFLIPPLILLAAYGLVRAVHFLLRQRRAAPRWAAVALLALTVASYAMVVADMAALSPYEYSYFSPLVGGLPGAAGRYETDYYATCRKPAAEWLSQHYRDYTSAPQPTFYTSGVLGAKTVAPYLPASFQENAIQPDFFIGMTRYHDDLSFPGYKTIHVVAVEGAPLCVVKINPATIMPSPPVT